jgi:tRNA(Ile)-lysidine synthase
MSNLVKKVQDTIFQNNLFPRGAKILLGVSGGPDSVSMLDILAKLAPKYNLKLIIAHVNYGLRGKDSEKDEKFVRELGKKLGIEVKFLNVNKGNLGDRGNLESKLRDIRYDFFEKVRKKNNFDLIAVAHNLDDQAETYLMRVIRGSGLQGLSAMKFKNERVIRPLLSITREEIIKYLKENKLTWRVDKTNLESKFLRNKIRNKFIPYLEKNFNPDIKKTIFNSSISIAEDYDFLEKLLNKEYKKNKPLKVSTLAKLHPAIQKRILRIAIGEVKKDLKDIDTSHIEEIIKAMKSTKGKNQIVVFKGLKITRRGDRLNIEKLNN